MCLRQRSRLSTLPFLCHYAVICNNFSKWNLHRNSWPIQGFSLSVILKSMSQANISLERQRLYWKTNKKYLKGLGALLVHCKRFEYNRRSVSPVIWWNSILSWDTEYWARRFLFFFSYESLKHTEWPWMTQEMKWVVSTHNRQLSKVSILSSISRHFVTSGTSQESYNLF